MDKIAFFIDWENFKQDIYAVQKFTKKRVLNFYDPADLLKLFKSFIDTTENIYRIFFYTSFPFKPENLYNTIMERKNLTPHMITKFKEYYEKNKNDMYNFYLENTNFLNGIAAEEYMALRAGELKVNGLNEDASPIFVQKQVDMLIGLDIAHVSYRHYVDKVIIFSKDTDIKPALKIARLNGIETIIGNLHKGHKIPDSLRKHSDHVRTRILKSVFFDSGKESIILGNKNLEKKPVLKKLKIESPIKNIIKEKLENSKENSIKTENKNQEQKTEKNKIKKKNPVKKNTGNKNSSKNHDKTDQTKKKDTQKNKTKENLKDKDKKKKNVKNRKNYKPVGKFKNKEEHKKNKKKNDNKEHKPENK